MNEQEISDLKSRLEATERERDFWYAATEEAKHKVNEVERDYEAANYLADSTSKAWKAAQERISRLEEAVKWALGEGEHFPARSPGEGAYWWRTELRNRAALQPAQQGEGAIGWRRASP